MTTIIDANVFSADLVVPPNGQQNASDTYNTADKFFYKDNSIRNLVYNAQTLTPNYIQNAVYDSNPVYSLTTGENFVGFNLPVDMDMLSPYEPISNEKIYLGL